MHTVCWALCCLSSVTLATENASCSRAMRIGAQQSSAQMVNTEESWLKQFLDTHHCGYSWLAIETSTHRRLQMMANGELDIILTATRTAEREKIAFFSKPYEQEIFRLLVKNTAPLYPSLDDYWQNNYYLIMPRYGVYPDNFMQWRKKFAQRNLLTEYKDAAQGFTRLQRGRQSVLLISESLYRSSDLQDLRVLDFSVMGDPVHVMFGRATTQPQDVELFNHWLSQHPIGRTP